MTDVHDLADRLRAFAAARDWEQHHTPKNLLLALNGEVGELRAELQWHPTDAEPETWASELRQRVTDEVASVLFYLVRFAGRLRHRPDRHRKAEDRAQRGALPAPALESPRGPTGTEREFVAAPTRTPMMRASWGISSGSCP